MRLTYCQVPYSEMNNCWGGGGGGGGGSRIPIC